MARSFLYLISIYDIFAVFFLFMSITPSILETRSTSVRSEIGEFCNSTHKCNKGAWLICKNGICDCFRSDEMLYDSLKQKCVSKAGERCKFELNSDLQLIEQTDCVSNSNCSSDGICGCQNNFYEALNGTCLPQKNFQENCNSRESCRSDGFLECIEGFCACNTSISEYSETIGQCVGLGTQSCLNEKCTENANCSLGKCVCSPIDDVFQDSDGTCQLKEEFGGSCKTSDGCKSKNMFLQCVDGICTCNPSTMKYELAIYSDMEEYEEEIRQGHPAYDWQKGYRNGYGSYASQYQTSTRTVMKNRYECVGRTDQACSSNHNCVENAKCNGQNICVCNQGYFTTAKGICGLDYKEACNENKVCSDIYVCTEGTCNCKDQLHQIYSARSSSDISKCLSIVAGVCSNDSDCIPNSVCDPEEGRCRCAEDYVENGVGHCEVAHGSPCDYKSSKISNRVVCDTLANLQCRNERCSCPEMSMVFDENQRKCLQLVGARCSEDEENCVQNAKCSVRRTGLSGICECLEGFVLISNKKCGIINGEELPISTTTEKVVVNNIFAISHVTTNNNVNPTTIRNYHDHTYSNKNKNNNEFGASSMNTQFTDDINPEIPEIPDYKNVRSSEEIQSNVDEY